MNELKSLIEEINSLQLARDLLEEIWIELGPYTHKISDKLSSKLNDYFNFDDSE